MMQVHQTNVNLEYDREFDYLYIFVGEPSAAETEAIAEGVYIRRSPIDERIVGAIIEDYSKKSKDLIIQLLPFKISEEILP